MIDFSGFRDNVSNFQRSLHSIEKGGSYISDGVNVYIPSTYTLPQHLTLEGKLILNPDEDKGKVEFFVKGSNCRIEMLILIFQTPNVKVKKECKNKVRIKRRKSIFRVFKKCQIEKEYSCDQYSMQWYERFFNSTNGKGREWTSTSLPGTTEYVNHPWPFSFSRRDSILVKNSLKIRYQVSLDIWNLIKMEVKTGDEWIRQKKKKYISFPESDWGEVRLCARLRHYLPEEIATMSSPLHRLFYDTSRHRTSDWFEIAGTKGDHFCGMVLFFPEGSKENTLSITVNKEEYMKDIPLIMFSQYADHTLIQPKKDGLYMFLLSNIFGIGGQQSFQTISLKNNCLKFFVSGERNDIIVQFITIRERFED